MRRGVVVAATIAIVLTAAAIWCVWVIRSASALRDEVAANVGALEETRAVRTMALAAAVTPADRVAAAEALAANASRRAPAAAPHAERLVAAVQRLAASPDDVDARAGVDAALDGITVALRAANRRVSLELGNRWDSLNLVALTVLALAAGLLAATAISHRLRLRSEAMEAALRARTSSLQAAATQWANGDLSAPLTVDARSADDFGAVLEQLRVSLAEHVAELERRHREIQVLVDDLRAQLIRKAEQLSAQVPARVEPSPRVIAGQYEIGAPLGVGGMGTVHHARRLSDGRRVALKLMNQPRDAVHHGRFVREARLLAEVHHPNVIRILDVGMHDGQPYLVTELVEGANLAAETAPWSVERALPVLTAVADGLTAIHAHGIVHRDIKPGNVVVGRTTTGDDLTKILDFGIARDAGDPGVALPPTPPDVGNGITRVVPLGRGTPLPGGGDPLTADGVMVGTLRYIAPEGRLAAPLTAAADIFSFGVLAVKLLTGDYPWSVPLVTLLRSKERPPPPTIDAPLPDPLRELLLRCLALDPLERPTAATLRDACRDQGHSVGSSGAGRGNVSPAT